MARVVSAAATIAFVDGPPGADDQAGALVDDVFFLEPAVAQRLIHREEGIGGGVAHEAAGAAVDHGVEIDLDGAFHLGAEAHVAINRRRR